METSVSLFDVVLFLHIACAVVWVGAAVTLELLELQTPRAGTREHLTAALRRNGWFGMRVFTPAALGTLLTGIAAVAIGRPTFGQLWVIIAFLSVFAALVIGGGIIGRKTARLLKLLDQGADEHTVGAHLSSLHGWARFDLALLLFILFDMVMRPTMFDSVFFGVSAIFFIIVLGALFLTRGRTTARYTEGHGATEA